MPLTAIEFAPGIVKDDTPTAAKPRWTDCDGIRFVDGRPQVINGYEAAVSSSFSGRCRGLHSWQLAGGDWAVAVGTSAKLYVLTGGGLYDITPTYRYVATLGSNPISVTSGSATVTVTDAGHGASVGDSVTMAGVAAVGGITPNGTYTVVSVPTADTYTITHSSAATSTATGGGASATASYAWTTGLADGTGGLGFGTGSYGVGAWGTTSATDYRPRFWTFDNFGPDLIAAPLNGTIFRWTGGIASKAAQLSGAPRRVDTMFLDPNGLVLACGANEQVSGTFNPLLVRHSDIENITDWSASFADQAGEFPVRIGSRLVRGLPARGINLLWTDAALIGQTYTADPGLVYSYRVFGGECGLIGPNAAVVINGSALWMGNNGQFWQWAGGIPQPIPCPIRKYVFDNLSFVQADKVVAFSNAAFNEVGWLYADRRDGNECSRYALLNLTDGSWTIGTTNRTCRIDAKALPSPVSASSGGRVYFEERNASADGGTLSWSLTGSRVEIGDGDTLMEIQEVRPDFTNLSGSLNLYLDAYAFPQSPAVEYGPFAITSTTEQVFPLVTARQVAFRFEGSGAPASGKLGKLLADVVDTGDRF